MDAKQLKKRKEMLGYRHHLANCMRMIRIIKSLNKDEKAKKKLLFAEQTIIESSIITKRIKGFNKSQQRRRGLTKKAYSMSRLFL